MQPQHVVIIEDDAILGRLYTSVLKNAGYEITLLNSGNDAIARLHEIMPGMLILDLRLPGRSGEDILTEIREDEALKHLPVLIATANPAKAQQVEALADAVLLKPVSVRDLETRVEQLFSLRTK